MSVPTAVQAGGLADAAASPLPVADRLRLLGWASLLLLLVNLAAPSGGLIGIPVVFFLKNRLGLGAHDVALFNLWLGIPLYLAFLFGFLRDRWSPFGAGDRGHLMLFGAAGAAIYAVVAGAAPTYGLLLGGLLLATIAILMAGSAANAIFSGLGRHHLMAGQASAALNIAGFVPVLTGYVLGGALSDRLEGMHAAAASRALFLAGAALMAGTALFGAFGPKALFAEGERSGPRASPLADAGRLLRHWPVWPPFILLTLWNFAPAMGTALTYHLANRLHASDSQVGDFYAIFWASNLPTLLLYGWLCQRARLSRLLFWGTIIAIPQMLPLLFIHSAAGALMAAAPMGLVGGLACGAYIDLAIRSCPKALAGTMMMLAVTTAMFLPLRLGDLWGTHLYEHGGGFGAAILATTFVYALMLPTLLLVPRRLAATMDGEAAPAPVG